MRIRDSLTGKYISEEEANELTPERFVVERDRDYSEFLEKIYNELVRESDKLPNAPFVNVEDIKVVFMRYGMKKN